MSFPVNIRLGGEYEDVYLYKGLLYLWTTDNDLQVIDWNRLISAVSESTDKLVLKWGFTRNDFLRSQQFKDMLGDPMFSEDFSRKLLMFDETAISLEPPEIERFIVTIAESDIGDITDVLFYRDVMYISSLSGVYGKQTNSVAGYLYFEPTQQFNDAQTVSISAKYRTLTGACCEDGLFCWSSLDRDFQPTALYRVDKFIRSTNWLYSDFLTLGEDSFSYHVNLRQQDSKKAKQYGAARNDQDEDNGDTALDEGTIERYGVAVFDEASLIKEVDARLAPRTIFTSGNSVFVCGNVNGHHRLIRRRRPQKEKEFFEQGLVYAASYQDIHADVFWGGAIDAKTAVLDTDGGTLILHEKGEPYLLSDDLNVGVRIFPDSKWYVNLVCSVKEDHVLISCIWPIDPMLVLGLRYYDE